MIELCSQFESIQAYLRPAVFMVPAGQVVARQQPRPIMQQPGAGRLQGWRWQERKKEEGGRRPHTSCRHGHTAAGAMPPSAAAGLTRGTDARRHSGSLVGCHCSSSCTVPSGRQAGAEVASAGAPSLPSPGRAAAMLGHGRLIEVSETGRGEWPRILASSASHACRLGCSAAIPGPHATTQHDALAKSSYAGP